jgi:hypothetical protein
VRISPTWRDVTITSGANFNRPGRRSARFRSSGIDPDEKFKRQCEFRHSVLAMCSLTEKDIGEQADFRQSVTDSILMVIYITPVYVRAPI